MKELSIEEKAKRYDEAVEKLRSLHDDYDTVSTLIDIKEELENIFPEIKESEDERIKQLLLRFVKYDMSDNYSDDFTPADCVAWLEKQGKNNMGISEATKQELEDSLNKALEKEMPESWNEFLDGGEQKPNVNCLLSWSETDEKMLQSLEGIVKDYWAKAEQEKNEIKIREASNVSYFLKTIQKSPLCWIKCSDRLPNRDGIYLVVTDGLHNEVYDMARYDSIEGWHKASEIIYWMPIPQLNNKSIIEQKPAWSEEDEELLNTIINHFKVNVECTDDDDIIKWLKSLKDRVQPKQERSEEDEKMLNDIIKDLVHPWNEYIPDRIEDEIKWLKNRLKSLRPQSTWKPSDEQLFDLKGIAKQNEHNMLGKSLMSLYNDLLKLKG